MRSNDSIELPIKEWARELAREAAREAVKEHILNCPFAEVRERVNVLEERQRELALNLAKVVGMMVGAGTLGGLIGTFIAGGMT